MGGAQPLAVTGNGGAALCIEVDPWRAQRRLEHGYLDEIADSLDDGIARVEAAKRERRALSVAVVANCADVLPDLVARGWVPDVVTDQTSAHDALNGYVPHGLSLDDALELRSAKPSEYVERARESMAVHCRAMVDLQRLGAVVFDYGNGLRGQAQDMGFADAFAYPGFVLAYIRPLFARGAGPFRWACLSGSAADLAATDQACWPRSRTTTTCSAGSGSPRRRSRGRGCRPGSAGWATASGMSPARRSTTWSPRGAVSAPVAIGRDHLDAGSVASPERETEGMKDGTDAVADWPILNALLNTASGATWVSVHHGGGVGIGKSIHAGVVVVADGTDSAYEKVTRVLTNDPGTGVLRHADAGLRDRRAHRPRGRHPGPDARRHPRPRLAAAGLTPPVRRRSGQPVCWRAR